MAEAYAGWSLHDLKAAAAATDTTGLTRDADTLRAGSRQLAAFVRTFEAALGALAGNWTGTAAHAAAGNAEKTITTVADTRATAVAADTSISAFAATVRQTQREVAAIPDERFSWGKALAGGAVAGPVGIGLAAFGQHQEAERRRAHAAELVAQLDTEGHAHAAGMAAQPWAVGKTLADAPRPLPAAHGQGPARSTEGLASGDSGTARSWSAATDAHHSPTSDDRSRTTVDAPRSHDRHHASGPSSVTMQTGARPASSPTHLAAAGVPTGTPGSGDAALPPVNAGTVLVDWMAVVPAALGAGGGLGAVGSRIEAGGSTPSQNEHGPIRSGRAGVPGTPPEDGAPAPATPRPPANPATTGGSETVARIGTPALTPAEGRAAVGGYPPIGPAAARRDDEDELRERPEYLIEPDDLWGDGRTAAPPVLG